MSAVENIFPFMGGVANEDDAQTYENYVASLIADAVDYDESMLSPDRIENQRYYNGEYPRLSADPNADVNGLIADEDLNRSQAVSTDVQDTVMGILPSLMRIFTSSEHVADFKPTRPDQVDKAAEQTDYINYIFNEENGGFLILHSVFKDAMINRIGVVRWWTENAREVKERTFESIGVDELKAMIDEWMAGDENSMVEVVDAEQAMATLNQETGLIGSITVRYLTSSPCHKVEAVPPEEFRIDRRAKSIQSAMLVGQQRLVTISDMVQWGYDEDEVIEFAGNYNYGVYSEEREERTPGIDTAIINNRVVDFGEYFVRVDQDGDGIAELRYICVVGDSYRIVSDEPADYVKFAVFCGDPTPHTVVGRSVTDLVKDIQNINTQLLRAALDSASSSMFPDTYVNEYTVNLEDQLNDEVGKTIRVKGDPNGAIKEFRPSFIGEQVFMMMSQMDALRQRRTGISEASKGIDPKALQSTSVMGVEAIVSGAQERIELIARIFAETGFKELFKGLIREVCDHPNIKKTVELRGKWVQIDHSLFDPNMRVSINPTMARGNDIARIQALTSVKETQLAIIGQFGPGNPIVTPQNFMNTIEDMLAIANIKNMNRYFNPVTPELIKSLQDAPKEPSPEELIAKAEIEKVKAQTAKTLAELRQKGTEMSLDEDFRRDKLGLDSMIGLIGALQKGTGNVGEAERIEKKGNTPNG